ncbi:MAG TPA: energy transducer TonB [Candidatus Acidoferrales bacterium]|jgi:protein TonB|nr:energy transducer TonB [Candidatus Acidoferrales bacterium]
MFQRLIESRAQDVGKRSIRAGALSVVAHAAIIAGAVAATATVGHGHGAVVVETPIVFFPEPRSEPNPPQAPPEVGTLLKEIRTVEPPIGLPLNVPPLKLQGQFNPAEYSAIAGAARSAGGGEANSDVYLAAIIEDKPSLLAAPQPRYPEMLLRAGIHGRVVVEAIIDTTGRAEPGSIKILQTPNSAFDKPSREWMARALFHPGRVHGRPVRVLVNAPINYEIVGATAF